MEKEWLYLLLTLEGLVILLLLATILYYRRELFRCRLRLVRFIHANLEMKAKLPYTEQPRCLRADEMTPEEFYCIVKKLMKRFLFIASFLMLFFSEQVNELTSQQGDKSTREQVYTKPSLVPSSTCPLVNSKTYNLITSKISNPMAEKIIYQINGQLVDNTVTVDNKEDMILVPVSNGSADQSRIIAEMKAEDSSLREETILHVVALYKRMVTRLLMSGVSVNDGLYYASASFKGVIENVQWNPEKNSIVVNFQVGAELREAIKNTRVNILGEKASTMFIGGVSDVSTRATDASATAGRAFTLMGSKIKVVGTDPSVGITLTSESGTVTQVTEALFIINDPSKVTFIIPANLADGTYTLKLTTQFSGNSAAPRKTPRSVEKTIYIGTASATGGNTGDGGTTPGGDGSGGGSGDNEGSMD